MAPRNTRSCSRYLRGMNSSRTLLASLSVLAVLLASGSSMSLAQSRPSTPAVAPQAPRESDADRALLELLDEDLEATKRANPVAASVRGDRRFDRELTDESEAAYLARARAANDMLVRLAQIDIEQLSDENRLNHALLERDLRDRAAGARFKRWQTAVTNLSGPQQSLARMADRLSFDTSEQKRDFIVRLRQSSRLIDQTIENLRAGIREGRVQPRTAVAATPEQAFSGATDEHRRDPTTHPLYAPFRDLDADDPGPGAALPRPDGAPPAGGLGALPPAYRGHERDPRGGEPAQGPGLRRARRPPDDDAVLPRHPAPPLQRGGRDPVRGARMNPSAARAAGIACLGYCGR